MARIPDEAISCRKQLTQGAWNLYVQYCAHRNRDTGRCDPGLALLAETLERTYRHVSDCKTELVKKGWVRRAWKNSAELLVGDFGVPKVREFGKNPNSSSEKSELRAGPSSGGIRTQVRKASELGAATPICEPEKEPVAAAAAAAPSAPVQDPLAAEVTEEFVAGVIADGLYPEAHVAFVWRKLRLRCRAQGAAPVVRQFLHWLSTERHTPQQELPGMALTVSEATVRPAAERLGPLHKDPACPRCFGTGYEVVAGRGARRCQEEGALAPPEFGRKEAAG